MVVSVETADGKCQLARKQNFRLYNVTALRIGTPNLSDAEQIFQRMNTPLMFAKKIAACINIQTDTYINGVGLAAISGHMFN